MDDIFGITAPANLAVPATDTDWCRDVSARIHAGDTRAESELIQRFEPGLRTVLWRLAAGDSDGIRDLCQDTLLIVVQRLRSRPLEDPDRLAAFAAQTARNLAITDYRRHRRRFLEAGDAILPTISDPAPRPVENLSVNAAVEAVRELLPELRNDRDREVLERVYVRDQDKSTVCRDMDMPEAVFNQVLSRARERFRLLLERRGYQKHDFL